MVIVDSDNGSNQMVLITVILMIGMTVKKKNLNDKFSPASNYVPTPTRNLSPLFVTKSFKQKAVNI